MGGACPIYDPGAGQDGWADPADALEISPWILQQALKDAKLTVDLPTARRFFPDPQSAQLFLYRILTWFTSFARFLISGLGLPPSSTPFGARSNSILWRTPQMPENVDPAVHPHDLGALV